jgi:hypothetical protein
MRRFSCYVANAADESIGLRQQPMLVFGTDAGEFISDYVEYGCAMSEAEGPSVTAAGWSAEPGEANVYPQYVPTRECDDSANDAVSRAADGRVSDPYGQPLLCGKPAKCNAGLLTSRVDVANALPPFMRSVQPVVHFK